MSSAAPAKALDGLNKDTFKEILSEHFNTRDVEILECGEGPKLLEGQNDYFNSEIKKTTVIAKINGEQKELPMVFK